MSATEASRSFWKLLDAVERGHRYLVRRRGADICVMATPEEFTGGNFRQFCGATTRQPPLQ